MSQVTMKCTTNLVFLLTVGIFFIHYNLLNLPVSIPGSMYRGNGHSHGGLIVSPIYRDVMVKFSPVA